MLGEGRLEVLGKDRISRRYSKEVEIERRKKD